MKHKTDDQLARLLNSYAVADADVALLDRIIAGAQATQSAPVYIPVWRSWKMDVAALAFVALLGFWFGLTSLPATSGYVFYQANPSNTAGFDDIILGATTWKAVKL